MSCRAGLSLSVLILSAGLAAGADNAPISVVVTSALDDQKGFGKLMSSASTGDVERTARDVEVELKKHRYLQMVGGDAEVVVNVDRRERTETSRSTNKKGELTVNHRYTASATVRIGKSERDRVDADTTYSQGPSSTRDDRAQFESVAKELSKNIAARILQSLDELRPNRPRAGFDHKAKYKMLFRGDGLEVTSVDPGGPAAEAGLEAGDRIRSINGEKGTDQMNAKVQSWWTDLPGAVYTLEVERNKLRRNVQIALVEPGRADRAPAPRRAAAPRAEAARPETPRPVTGSVAASGRTSNAPASSSSSAGDTDLKPGMTQPQVTRALGEPQKKVTFGAKQIWTYDGFTVTFVDGKVTDVK